jgi:D-alanyl-lipoteichoic acid acyltransferase DltB (MBOAT superfamily)
MLLSRYVWSWSSLAVIFILYPPVAWLGLRLAPARQKSWIFAAVNLLGAYGLCLATGVEIVLQQQHGLPRQMAITKVVTVAFVIYLALLLLDYWLLHLTTVNSTKWGVIALWFPIFALIVIKYVPWIQHSFSEPLRALSIRHVSELFLGLSYLTFRVCRLAQEVRDHAVEMPALSDYLAFTFFVPTLSLGPISPFSTFIASYRNANRARSPIGRSLLRMLIGLTKFIVLSNLLNQYTYTGLLLDGHHHGKLDLAVAVFSYTLYLYCNFSGFCDMVVGVSGLLGIEVMENFNAPFASRNLQEFWTRWHISLSVWLRDMMFTPVVRLLVTKWGPKSANHAIAVSICCVFVVIGVWHGVGANFALFGLAQGVGLASVHYYTLFIKKRLGRQRYVTYGENPYIRAFGRGMTFVYVSLSLFLFANNWENMGKIFKSFR